MLTILILLSALLMGGPDCECQTKRQAARACNQLDGPVRHQCVAAYKARCEAKGR